MQLSDSFNITSVTRVSHGELIALLKKYDMALSDAKQQMRELVQHFNHQFDTPFFQLAYHLSGGVTSLRFRMRDESQRYFDLCASELGQNILSGQTPAVSKALLDLDAKRIDVNFYFQTHYYLRKRLRLLRKNRAAIKAARSQWDPARSR